MPAKSGAVFLGRAYEHSEAAHRIADASKAAGHGQDVQLSRPRVKEERMRGF